MLFLSEGSWTLISASLFLCFSMKVAVQPLPHKIIQELGTHQLESQKPNVQGEGHRLAQPVQLFSVTPSYGLRMDDNM